MPQLSMKDKGKIIGMNLSGMTNYCIARVLRIQYRSLQLVYGSSRMRKLKTAD